MTVAWSLFGGTCLTPSMRADGTVPLVDKNWLARGNWPSSAKQCQEPHSRSSYARPPCPPCRHPASAVSSLSVPLTEGTADDGKEPQRTTSSKSSKLNIEMKTRRPHVLCEENTLLSNAIHRELCANSLLNKSLRLCHSDLLTIHYQRGLKDTSYVGRASMNLSLD